MIEKGKISAFQFGLLFYTGIFSTSVLTAQGVAARLAKQDMWLLPLAGSATGYLTVILLCYLGSKFPDQTIIEYSGHILGKVAGKLLGLYILIFALLGTGIVLRQYVDFIGLAFLPRTPNLVLAGTLVFVCTFVVRSGLEILGRSAQFFTPVLLGMLTLVILLAIHDFDVTHILPVLEKGVQPLLKGGLYYQAWYALFVFVSFYYPYVKDRRNARKWGLLAVAMDCATMVASNMMALFVLGPIIGAYNFPFMIVGRYIALGEFFEHLESIIMVMWVVTLYLRICFTYYILALGTAQWCGLTVYRPLVYPLGILIVLFALWISHYQDFLEFAPSVTFLYLLTGTGIPVLLAGVYVVRKWTGRIQTGRE